MFYLILASASSALVSILMRLSGKRVSSDMGLLSVNYLMCTVLALVFAGSMEPGPALFAAGGMGAVNGLFYLAGFLLLPTVLV